MGHQITLDIAYKSNNSLEKKLSNLYPREFEFYGKKYRSIEHAYQTWKSGDFDAVAYRSTGLKPKGTKRVNKSKNIEIMRVLMYENFTQNPDLCKLLAELDFLEPYSITHSVGSKFWKIAFVECLRFVLAKIKQEFLSPNTL